MTNILSNICDAKRGHIEARKKSIPESALREAVKKVSPPRGFKRALETKLKTEAYALITEIKKSSPSGGLIRKDFNPAELAKAYESAGATCLSVLTDTPYFQGEDTQLRQARDGTKIPALRKDFILDPYQITESRALGADCILLIMAALEDSQAQQLYTAATEWGMDVLVEVHNEAELHRALKFSPQLLGINNRDLKTLKTDLTVSERLAKEMPRNILGVCESGICTHGDLERMKKAGLSCFLVGESLLREQDVAAATRHLLGAV